MTVAPKDWELEQNRKATAKPQKRFGFFHGWNL